MQGAYIVLTALIDKMFFLQNQLTQENIIDVIMPLAISKSVHILAICVKKEKLWHVL
jgi:hypothetical protein